MSFLCHHNRVGCYQRSSIQRRLPIVPSRSTTPTIQPHRKRLAGADIIYHAASNDTSVYFVDPWANSLELMTQYAAAVTEHFGEGKQFYPESAEVQT